MLAHMVRPRAVASATTLSGAFRRHVASASSSSPSPSSSSPSDRGELAPFSRWRTAKQTQDELHARQAAEEQAKEGPAGEMHGWVQSVRTSKTMSFIDVVDGSRMGVTQAIVSAHSSAELDELAAKITPGSAVRLKGTWTPSRLQLQQKGPSPGTTVKSRFELDVTSGEVVGDCDSKNKYQTPQFLRTIPHLRARAPLHGEVARFRSDMIRAFTNYFADAGFAQVHPPVITSSDCEGAGEAFVVRPAAAPSPPEGGDKGAEYFGAPKYLTVSSQLHLEAMAQGLGAVWALAPVFRAEDSDTGRHLSEFYMLEAELAFAGSLDVVMDLAESCLASSTRRLQETSGEAWIDRPWENEANARSLVGAEGASATILAKETAALRWKGITQKTNPWPRITYTEAMGILSKHADRFEHKPMWGAELQTEHEKFLALEVGGADSTLGHVPVFVTHYPRDTKAFYMAPSDSPQGPTVACFDLLLPGTGELVGGSLREHRLEPLVAAMRRCGIAPGPSMDWYLDLRRWGCPPHGGFGVGVDRLLSWLTAIPNVRDTATFPRWSGRCDC